MRGDGETDNEGVKRNMEMTSCGESRTRENVIKIEEK